MPNIRFNIEHMFAIIYNFSYQISKHKNKAITD
jgi:hypothetical protein